MREEFSAKLTGRFVDDDDIVRTGRAMLELDGFDMLHLPIPEGYKEQIDGLFTAAQDDAEAARQSERKAAASANRAANIAGSTSWSGDRLTVNGKTSPSLSGPRGPEGFGNTTTVRTEAEAQALTGLPKGHIVHVLDTRAWYREE